MSGSVLPFGTAELQHDADDALPPPMAPTAERVLMAAILEGEVTPEELGGFDADCICEPVLRHAFRAVAELGSTDMASVAERMRANGVVGPIAEALLDARDTVASYPRRIVLAAAAQLVELRRRRLLLRTMAQVDAELRADRITHAEALDQIAQSVGGVA